jgi:hypothetical protein
MLHGGGVVGQREGRDDESGNVGGDLILGDLITVIEVNGWIEVTV